MKTAMIILLVISIICLIVSLYLFINSRIEIRHNKKDIHDKTFDIVDAFMHLIWGRKVRMTHWGEGEYIELKDCNLQIGEKWIIRNNGKLFPAEKLFDKDSIEARWEDYKEENINE